MITSSPFFMPMQFVPIKIPDLERELDALLAQLPAGRVTTYGRLAEALGDRVAARWVGHVMLHHRHVAACGCHRVVRADGSLGENEASTAERTRRLAAEGVAVVHGKVDLGRFGFDAFQCDRPLLLLREVQETVASQVELRAAVAEPDLVGGVDVAYHGEEGVAAYALIETATGKLAYSTTVRRKVSFPYITSYLSFRELPLYAALWEVVCAAGRAAEVVLVDGSGTLHPRHVGIASHLGVAAGVATIGVTKKLLAGRVDIEGMARGETRPIVVGDRVVGVALRPTAGSRRPIFISPGHRVDLPFSASLVQRFLFGRRLPAPIYWADRLSGRAK